MKRTLKSVLLAIIALCFANIATAQSVIDAPSITPIPVQCKLSATNYAPFTAVTISTNDASALKWAKTHLSKWYGKYAPEVTIVPYSGEKMADDAYSFVVNDNGIQIKAVNIVGVRYALFSLRQIVIPGRGTQKVESYIVPRGEVCDYPTMKFRGIHICWFPENQEWEIERMIRMAAYYKFNYVILEQWGTYQSRVAPWLNWPNPPMTKKAIKRFVALSKELGVTLIPQLNIFGHASFSRNVSGKHATIDIRPEYRPLFEPVAGWNWCLSNPETRKLINAMIVELLEDFDNPPFFHIGCDEALKPNCPECCKQPYSELLVDYIGSVHKILAERGVRAMMWQDMLLEKGDPRWHGYKANGTAETAKAAETLPKDIVICDWFYKKPRQNYESYTYFKSLGYDHLACPWDNRNGIIAQAKAVEKAGTFGVLATIWNHYSGHNLANIYVTTSSMAWNTNATPPTELNKFKTHFREVGWDSNLKKYRQFGIFHTQVPPTTYYNPAK